MLRFSSIKDRSLFGGQHTIDRDIDVIPRIIDDLPRHKCLIHPAHVLIYIFFLLFPTYLGHTLIINRNAVWSIRKQRGVF